METFMKKVIALVLLFGLSNVNASMINFFSPDSVNASNTSEPGTVSASPNNLINGSGIDVGNITLDNISSVSHAPVGGTAWRGSSSAMPITINFNFNSVQTIGYIGLWQAWHVREGTGDFNLRFFDGLNGVGNQIGTTFYDSLYVGDGSIDSISLAGQAFNVGERVGVKSISMQITSIAVPANPYVHLGEFMVATSVSEPGQWGILLIGMLLLGIRQFKLS